LTKKKIEEQPRKWHLTLNEALWAYRMACHGSIKSSPYELVYGHNAVLPWEIQTGLRRVTLQNDLTSKVYKNLMMDDLEDLSCLRLRTLENIEANKLRVARHYNKKVKNKQFCEGELVWKVRLPIGSKDSRFGKWSHNWEGPYWIKHRASGYAYILETLEGCNTSGVLNPKICHVIICIAHHFGVSENFDMHSLKQVYFYDYMC